MSKKTVSRMLLVSLLGVCVGGPAVEAAVHLMKIEQVIGGVNGDTTAQAFQLRMRAAGQTVLGGTRIRAWDAMGANPIVIVNFNASVSNGALGARILAVTPAFVNMTSPSAVDDTTAVVTPIPASYLAAGSLTFETDNGSLIYFRLSWGGDDYEGDTTGGFDNDTDGEFGPPFPGPLPSSNLQALQFQGTAGALSTNNAANFALTAGAAVFTNNAGTDFKFVGACCDDSTGICTGGQTELDCENAGNRYGGNGSTCGNISPPCLEPSGACCDDSTGICTEDQSETACLTVGGRWGGDDSTCATINPQCVAPTGACCDDSTGICTEDQSETACLTAGGRWGGDDSTCATINPQCVAPTGACCDDSTEICTEDQSETACLTAGGRWGGDDSTCATISPPCLAPTGACCDDPTGVCQDDLTQTDCESGGDRYVGDDSTCADIDPCLQPDAPLPNPLHTCSGNNAVCDPLAPACPAGQTCNPWTFNRFLSFSIPTTSAGSDTAIRVKLTSLHHPVPPLPSGGVPSFAALEVEGPNHYRYVNKVGRCCNPTSPATCDPSATCLTDSDCSGLGSNSDCTAINRCCNPASNPTTCHPSATCTPDPASLVDPTCSGLGLNTNCQTNMCPDSAVFNTFFRCARLGCTPEYTDWATEFEGGDMYVYGDTVITDSTYEVAHLASSCLGSEASCSAASAELTVRTPRWGNVDNSGGGPAGPAAPDIGRVTAKVQNALGSFIEPRCQLREATPNPLGGAVSAQDIGRVIDAVQGKAYPFTTIVACE